MSMVHASIVCVFLNLSSVLYSFLSTGLLPPWLGFFLGTLFFLLLYQMGFTAHISVSDISFLMYKNAFNILRLTLYPTAFPNSLIRSSSFLVESIDFLCTLSCHLQTMTVLLLLVHLHDGILHSRKKEGAPTLCDNMDGTGEHYAK